MKFGKRIATLGLLIAAWGFAGAAYAVTPGNTLLTNVATLTYGAGTTVTASSTVNVNVVASAPTLTVLPTIEKAENQALSEVYTLTATNNGPDTYTLTSPAAISGNVNAENIGNYTYDKAGAITSVSLGASALAVVSTATTTITVPSDGVADGFINGLGAGDKVVIAGVEYTIAAGGIADTGAGNQTITLTTAVPAGLPVGTGVFERQSFNIVASDIGDRIAVGTAASYDVTTTLTSGIDGGVTATNTFTVSIFRITITKYVRNTTTANCTGGTGCDAVDIGGVKYHLTGGGTVVTANPNHVLEYLLRVTTPTEAGVANAVIKDVLPTFTTFETGTTKLNTQTVDDENTGNNADGNGFAPGKFPLDPAADGGGLLIQNGTPTTSGDEGTGTVAAASTVDILYQVRLSAL